MERGGDHFGRVSYCVVACVCVLLGVGGRLAQLPCHRHQQKTSLLLPCGMRLLGIAAGLEGCVYCFSLE